MRRGFAVMAVLLLMRLGDAVAQSGRVTSASPVEQQLAALDQGTPFIRVGSEAPYRLVLDHLAPKCTEARSRISDMAVTARSIIKRDVVATSPCFRFFGAFSQRSRKMRRGCHAPISSHWWQCRPVSRTDTADPADRATRAPRGRLVTSIDLQLRDIEVTADLVRARLERNELLRPLADAGRPAELGYTHRYIWLESGDEVLAKFLWPNWWVPGLDTREDHAAQVAYHLVIEAGKWG
jgi:hypothetical protein